MSGIAARLTHTLADVLGYAASLVPASLWTSSRPESVPPFTRAEPPSVASPVSVAPPPVPSLMDVVQIGIRHLHDDALMQAAETWPVSRNDVLLQVRRKLQATLARLAAATRRSGVVLTDVFTNLDLVGAGKYGAVYVACIRRTHSDSCEQFLLDIPAIGRCEVTIFLAVKTIQTPDRVMAYMRSLRAVSAFSGTAPDGTWYGHVNVMREVLLGRFLNHLVQAGVTPHFPMVYETFELDARPDTTAIVMELCHMDFNAFLTEVLPRIADTGLRLRMLQVALMQLAHGIAAAQFRLDFRHNDLHDKNAMMTFITNTVYTYAVRGTAYAVRNYGMCWKLTDFGFGSSSYLFGGFDTVHALQHTRVAQHVQVKKGLPSHAIETVDFLRLLRCAGDSASKTGFLPQVDFCMQVEAAIHGLTDKVLMAKGSLLAFADRRHDTETLLEMSRWHGLMTEVFILLASPLVVDATEAAAVGGPSFDMDARLFTDGLTGMERHFYTLDARGGLRAARK